MIYVLSYHVTNLSDSVNDRQFGLLATETIVDYQQPVSSVRKITSTSREADIHMQEAEVLHVRLRLAFRLHIVVEYRIVYVICLLHPCPIPP